ncbi:LytR C-terminal domain-containing protein [Endomicrobium proavitum]|uniref:LytR/CpsA/Psr regulator C-terminal domain-containing protein n=1 Tax=Endomicrobium proavitum TaxID=1408281 RepID=A0A0G3WLK0_9BACT|nr:LytR C-terminal domain-containing protein [Endomicrobium proavitum]AKL98379.1 hypothetical protein Epro_1000 [Endomicrobium proavitum]
MPQNEKLKKYLIAFAAAIIIIVAAYFTFFRTDPFIKNLMSSDTTRFTLILYGTEKTLPQELNAFLISYEKKSKVLKIVTVNTDVVVLKKRVKAESLKANFNKLAQKDINRAVENCLAELAEITNDNFKADYYIAMDYDVFSEFVDKKQKNIIVDISSGSRTFQLFQQLQVAKNVVKKIKSGTLVDFFKARSGYKNFNTNISKKALSWSVLYFDIKKTLIMFCDLPVRNSHARTITDSQNADAFFEEVYFPQTNLKDFPNITIEVRNASKKQRMGEKVSWFLREKKFDVADWSNYPEYYEQTIIKDYKGNFALSLKLAKILGCQNIIISYNKNSYYGAGVLVGADCEVYDKFDKSKTLKRGQNGKN